MARAKATVSNETLERLIELGYSYDIYEGTLIDNFIFYDTGDIKFDGLKPTDFIILKESYVNCWTSELELITTNDIMVVNQYQIMFSN